MVNINLLNKIFKINSSIKLSIDDQEYLVDLEQEIKKYITLNGTEGNVRIREIVLDTLLDDKKENIIKFLNLDFNPNLRNEFDTKLNGNDYLKFENKEQNKDFFKSYLIDESLNDLYFSLKGYMKKNEGNKESFIKVRSALIPNPEIDALYNLLIANFNKINFVSNKEDEEQAEIIILTLRNALLILLHIDYRCCDTSKTVQIMSMLGTKMMNLIGYSKGNRDHMFNTMGSTYHSQDSFDNKPKKLNDIY